jgi:hypothetical protein
VVEALETILAALACDEVLEDAASCAPDRPHRATR